jgi:cyanophycin synthetase
MNRAIEAAVFENGSDTILGEGLAYDRCQVGVSPTSMRRGISAATDIETPEQVFTVLRTQVDLVLPTGAAVLNAKPADAGRNGAPVRRRSHLLCTRPRNCRSSSNTGHKASGPSFVRNGQIVLASGQDESDDRRPAGHSADRRRQGRGSDRERPRRCRRGMGARHGSPTSCAPGWKLSSLT